MTAALPPLEAVDTLAQKALPAFIAHAAALQARAAARLGGAEPARSDSRAGEPATPAEPAPLGGQGDRLLTSQEVAELLNAKPAWVYRHKQQLGGQKLDGLLRFSARRVQAYIERQRRQAA